MSIKRGAMGSGLTGTDVFDSAGGRKPSKISRGGQSPARKSIENVGGTKVAWDADGRDNLGNPPFLDRTAKRIGIKKEALPAAFGVAVNQKPKMPARDLWNVKHGGGGANTFKGGK